MSKSLNTKSVLLFFIAFFWFLVMPTIVCAEVILFEDFEDSSGFTIGGGNATGYWGIAPLSGTESIPSYFVQGGSQSGNIFYGSFGKDFSDLTASPTMTISLPDLTNYTNLQLTVALAAPYDPLTIVWEIAHRDKLEISSDSGIIDLFRPISNTSPLRSQTYLIDLGFTFQDFEYTIDSSLKSITFAFASTDYPETTGIDSVRITGDYSPPSQWIKTYGRTGFDEVQSIQQTSDGGYIVAGRTHSFGADNIDVWVLRLDSEGNVQWQKAYDRGTDYYDIAKSIQQTSDGGYIVAGSTGSFGNDVWVLRLDSEGNVQWQKTYGGSEGDYAYSVQQTTDGGYIVAGWTESFSEVWYDMWVLKLDSEGNVQWQKTYGGSGGDWAYSIQQTADGGYIMGGWTGSFGAGSGDTWILKLDGNGNVLWQKTYGGREGGDAANSIQQTSDGGYIVAGVHGSSLYWAAWVLKLDGNGNVLWQKTYGERELDSANFIQQTSDGGYIVAGTTNSFGAGMSDICLLRLDSEGNVQWQKTYGGSEGDYVNSIQQTSDGGYIMAGRTYSFTTTTGYTDTWVLKLDGNGDINNCSIVRTSNAQMSDTYATGQDTNVTGIDSYVSPQITTAFVFNTNAVVTEICYHGPDISVSPTSLNFGPITVGTSSTPQTFTISNTGTADLHISDMVLSDTVNYSLDVNGGTSPCESTTPNIAPNGSCTVTVTFSPLSTGQKDANLTINSDDPDTPTLNMSLSGTGFVDTDGDGVQDSEDNCPLTQNPDQRDMDNDSKGDACDVCPYDAENDIDSDGVCGNVDNCPNISNADQLDSDADGSGDVCDSCPYDSSNDVDKDGICGDIDNCPQIANTDQANADGDSIGDACDVCPYDAENDIDSDGVCGDVDNCPQTSNPNQSDTDGDAIGDVCDICPYDANNDIDGDNVCGNVDNCPFNQNPDQADMDNDGLGNVCDNDADGDGFTKTADCNDLDKDINPQACDIRNDGIDQDCNGVDRTQGKPCVGESDEGLKELACADGIDNDNDGLTDCADPDCARKKGCR